MEWIMGLATYVVLWLLSWLHNDVQGHTRWRGDGIDRICSRLFFSFFEFYSLPGLKGEGDSCQSSLIVAPLNSGVNGSLPDVNTA